MLETYSGFLQDFGVKVEFGDVSGLGILDSPDQILDQYAITSEYSLLCLYSDFGDVKFDDEITVDGESYKVRTNRKVDDGKFCRMLLTKL
jgi:hypothetical protein